MGGMCVHTTAEVMKEKIHRYISKQLINADCHGMEQGMTHRFVSEVVLEFVRCDILDQQSHYHMCVCLVPVIPG